MCPTTTCRYSPLKHAASTIAALESTWHTRLSAMLAYYRALLRERVRDPFPRPPAANGKHGWKVLPPTMLIFGEHDPFVHELTGRRSIREDLCRSGNLVRVPGAGHWLPNEHPKFVNDWIGTHLSRTIANFGRPKFPRMVDMDPSPIPDPRRDQKQQ